MNGRSQPAGPRECRTRPQRTPHTAVAPTRMTGRMVEMRSTLAYFTTPASLGHLIAKRNAALVTNARTADGRRAWTVSRRTAAPSGGLFGRAVAQCLRFSTVWTYSPRVAIGWRRNGCAPDVVGCANAVPYVCRPGCGSRPCGGTAAEYVARHDRCRQPVPIRCAAKPRAVFGCLGSFEPIGPRSSVSGANLHATADWRDLPGLVGWTLHHCLSGCPCRHGRPRWRGDGRRISR
jgi:hypothetical protein